MRAVTVVVLLAVGTGTLSSDSQLGRWPLIQAISGKQTYSDAGNGGDTPFLLVVKDRVGAPGYKIECHNGDYEDESGFNFSGDFHCAMFAISGTKIVNGNLLASEKERRAGRDWFNRGRMIAGQIFGPCAEYPDYGAVRRFRLRGMLVTFQFEDLAWFPFPQYNRHRLSHFTFRVSVVPDLSAQTEMAEQAPSPKPPKPCDW